MRLLSAFLLGTIGSNALALQLPNKTSKTTQFVPAAAQLAADPDFKKDPAGFKQTMLEVRKNPELVAEYAQTMVANEKRPTNYPGSTAEYHHELREYVADELRLEALARQYVLIIDKSGSMTAPDPDGGTRWKAAEKATQQLIQAMFKYDMDHKVPTYLFDHQVEAIGELTDEGQVMRLFREHHPERGTTNLADALDQALSDHIGRQRNNYEVVPGTTVVVITDGEPNSESRVEQILQKYADPQNGYISNDEELAVAFIQIGDDRGASRFLARVDDGFTYPNGSRMDICDTKKDDDLRKKGPEFILNQAIFD